MELLIIIAIVLSISLYILKDTILYELNQNALFRAIKSSKITLVLIDTVRAALFFYILFKLGLMLNF